MELKPMENIEKRVAELVDRAANCPNGSEAMQLTQAALNAAHALQVIETIKQGRR